MNRNYSNISYAESPFGTLSEFMSKTFGWMFAGLLVTFAVGIGAVASGLIYPLISSGLFILTSIAELVLVFVLTARVQSLQPSTATGIFFGYAVLNGLNLSSIFLVYDYGSLILAFLVGAVYFGVMAVYGNVTNRDLTGWGPKLMGGLVAIIVCALVGGLLSLFGLHFGIMDLLLCAVGLLIFMGLTAYDIYGLTEIIGPGVAFECKEQTGMHVNEDHFIVEVIDPDTGEVLPEGTQGELVFTCITKEAFPILRYRTRDIGVITRGKCSCGRTLVKMTKPRGRTDDMLIIRGVNVFPSQIETVLLEKGYTANYQIVVDRANNFDSIEVQVEISNEIFSDTVRGLAERAKDLAAALKTLLGVTAKVTLLEPNSIPRSEGKAVRVIDKRKLLD